MGFLFDDLNELRLTGLLLGPERERALELVRDNHYTHSVPSGKSHYFAFETAIVVYSIPANKNIGAFLLGRECVVWELSRMWAPDGHDRNLLSRAISFSVKALAGVESAVELLVSYADPNVGHQVIVYRAASWIYTGQSEEGRYYVSDDGVAVARRAFHSGDKCMSKQEIEEAGYRQLTRPGKHRFAKGLTRQARKLLRDKWGKL